MERIPHPVAKRRAEPTALLPISQEATCITLKIYHLMALRETEWKNNTQLVENYGFQNLHSFAATVLRKSTRPKLLSHPPCHDLGSCAFASLPLDRGNVDACGREVYSERWGPRPTGTTAAIHVL